MRPSSSSPGQGTGSKGHVRIAWGAKGKVEQIKEPRDAGAEEGDGQADESVEVEIRGILGVLRLWSSKSTLIRPSRLHIVTNHPC